jgi:HK97 family phage prohead protease
MTDSRSELLKGVPERRGLQECELREGKSGLLEFEGYAAVFDQPYIVSDRYGEFTEVIDRGALNRTLSRSPNVVLNVDHGGLPLARTLSGTLQIGTDQHGYYVRAGLEPRDPHVQAIRYKIERGDLSDMSWAFRVTVDEWTEDDTKRVVREVNVDGGDVSIVKDGANSGTSLKLHEALRSLKNFDDLLVEMRSADGGIELDDLHAVRKNVDQLITELTPRKTMSIKAAERAALLD